MVHHAWDGKLTTPGFSGSESLLQNARPPQAPVNPQLKTVILAQKHYKIFDTLSKPFHSPRSKTQTKNTEWNNYLMKDTTWERGQTWVFLSYSSSPSLKAYIFLPRCLKNLQTPIPKSSTQQICLPILPLRWWVSKFTLASLPVCACLFHLM